MRRSDLERLFAAAGGVLIETTGRAMGLTLPPEGGAVLAVPAGMSQIERDERIAAAIGEALVARCDRASLVARCDRASLVATLTVVFRSGAPVRD